MLTSNFNFHNFIDQLDFGIWSKISVLKDDQLRKKAEKLPILLQAGYATNTLNKYKPAWKKWLSWAESYPEVNACPADPFFVALYLNDLVIEKVSLSAITAAFHGIRWGHINCGYESPTNNPFVKLAFEGAKRSVEGTKNQKEPLDAEAIKVIINKFGFNKNVLQLRFVIMCLIGFAGFFRISELLDIQVKHITFYKGYIDILVEKSKMDQQREGHIVKIGETGTGYCPVYWLRKYLHVANLTEKPEGFVFCKLAKTKKGHNVNSSTPISYETARKSFLDHLKIVFNDVSKYGLHSLRSGGASAAANNGVSERLLGKHGRWSANSTTKDRYIKDNNAKRLCVSQSLGL